MCEKRDTKERIPEMLIAGHEVKILSKTEARVGCQKVSLSQLMELTRKMANFVPELKASDLPLYVLAISIKGPYLGQLFVRNPRSVTRIALDNRTITGGWSDDPDQFYKDVLRILTPEEIARITG